MLGAAIEVDEKKIEVDMDFKFNQIGREDVQVSIKSYPSDGPEMRIDCGNGYVSLTFGEIDFLYNQFKRYNEALEKVRAT